VDTKIKIVQYCFGICNIFKVLKMIKYIYYEKGVISMEHKLDKLTENISDIKTLIHTFNKTLENIEHRLSRLEQMDSIEHRVEVNQIDLSDIKESLQRIEEVQSTVVKEIKNHSGNGEHIQHINRRLDSHLIKLARAEEDIIILKNK
jgi:chromosome segregation ATPase